MGSDPYYFRGWPAPLRCPSSPQTATSIRKITYSRQLYKSTREVFYLGGFLETSAVPSGILINLDNPDFLGLPSTSLTLFRKRIFKGQQHSGMQILLVVEITRKY